MHVDEDEEIPDSLLHPRWKIQKTAPVEVSDLDTFAIDLRFPENIRQQVEYNDSTGMYVIGSKIGDNYLQEKARGYSQPESFTHGTSAQRMKWLKLGFDTGDIRRGNTFELSDSEL